MVFHECLLCILKMLLISSGIAQLADQREVLRRCHLACSSTPCSCRLLREGGSWLCPRCAVLTVDNLVPQGSAGKQVPRVGIFLVHSPNGSLVSGHKPTYFGCSRLKILPIFTVWFFLRNLP